MLTEREEAVRDTLVEALESKNPLYRLTYADEKRLTEDFDPAFVDKKRAEVEKKSRGAVVACVAWVAAAMATIYLAYSNGPGAVGRISFLMCATVGAASAYNYWMWHKRRLIYRTLATLANEKAPAA